MAKRKPKTTKRKPKTTKRKPKTTKRKPKTTKRKPKTTKRKPKTTKKKPKTIKKKPKITKKELGGDIHGAGIQPIAFYRGDIYFLLGKEANFKGFADSGKFSSFGGKFEAKKDRSVLETAVREGYEESMGLLGSKEDIRKGIKKRGLGFIENFKHRTYLYEIDYDKDLPKRFAEIYRYVKSSGVLRETDPDEGFFEKTAVKWFPSKRLARIAYPEGTSSKRTSKGTSKDELRFVFANSVGKMLSEIKKHRKT